MDMAVEAGVIKQHLIDPEICIRCNTCEATCPVNAITHDDNNYVVRADVCNGCMACISPCPTGSIDNWRTMPLVRAYTIEEQLTWESLPAELSPEELPKAWVREEDLLPSWERLLQLASSGLRACGPNTALKKRYLDLTAQLDLLRELPAR